MLGHIKCYATNLKSFRKLVLWYNSKKQVYTEHKAHSAIGTDLFCIDIFIT